MKNNGLDIDKKTESKENKNNDWLDNLHKNTDKLYDLSISLRNYSSSFYSIGLSYMGNRLANISDELDKIAHEINQASGKIVSEMITTASKNSENVFNAVLAGIEVGKENK